VSDSKSFVPAVLDKEIKTIEADAFGHQHFAEVLRGYVESPSNQPPFSIGLLGSWGSGKSSIKSLYLAGLEDDASKDSRKKKILPITFNAWRFGGEENIKRALLRQVYCELGGSRESIHEALFKQVQRDDTESRKFWDYFKEEFGQWLWNLAKALLVIVIFVGSVLGIARAFGLDDMTVLGWLATASTVVAAAMVKFLLDASLLPRRHNNVKRIESPQTSAEEFEELLFTQLKAFKDSKKGKSVQRIVIFVDDLDRLSPEEMISGLDAVRTFMEIPEKVLPDGLGVVFVISCDEDKVAGALSDKRRRANNPELPATVFTDTDAHRFLDRIFQFRMEIPPLPRQDMRDFATKALLKAIPDLQKQMTEGTSIETLIDRMIHVGVKTPRNALQVVNAFVQSWWLAKKRELNGGSGIPGGLKKGAVTDYPLVLGAICALRVDFPDFYRDLQNDPTLIGHFIDVFIRENELTDKPEYVQLVFARYIDKTKTQQGEPSTVVSKVKREHRLMLRFISSVQDLRYPKSLTPLLMLSQDSITQKFGDRAGNIKDSLISGHHQGVLEELGRENDSKEFSEADMTLIRNIVTELERESETYRNNSAAAIAALSQRFPSGSANMLLGPLARQLARSPELRWRLGMDHITSVLTPITKGDRLALVGELINDLLVTEGEIDFKLQSGEVPSLDEALEMSESVCDIALDLRKSGELCSVEEQKVLSWLETRHVGVAKKSDSLPFEKFEGWMGKHEDWMLPVLNERYSRLVIDQLSEGNSDLLEKEQVSRRIGVVFARLLSTGEESRDVLWSQISELIAVDDLDFAKVGIEFAIANVTTPNAEQVSKTVSALAARLEDGSGSVGKDDNVYLELANNLLDIVSKRNVDLSSSCGESLFTLVGNWSKTKVGAKSSTVLLTHLKSQFETNYDEVVLNWTQRVIKDLPLDCCDWLGKNFGKFAKSQRDQIVAQLAPLHAANNINQKQSNRLLRFLQNVSEPDLKTSECQTFLNSMLTFIQGQHANQHNYLKMVFTPIPRCLAHCDPGKVGTMLHTLFANTKNVPDLFAWLIDRMDGHWLQESEGLTSYKPEQIAKDAIQVISAHVAKDEMGGAIESIQDMFERDIVSNELSVDALNMACKAWQHHPEMAHNLIEAVAGLPSADFAAAMSDGLDASEASQNELLNTAWRIIASRADLEYRVLTGFHILTQEVVNTDEQDDVYLDMWVRAKDGDHQQLMEALVTHQEIADKQRGRAWQQSERHNFGVQFLDNTLPNVVNLEDSNVSIVEMIDASDKLLDSLSSRDEKYAVGKSAASSFMKTESADTKNRLAVLMKKVGNEKLLNELGNFGDVTREDLEILEQQFGKNSKPLRKYAANLADE
jgi:hypothetical protein